MKTCLLVITLCVSCYSSASVASELIHSHLFQTLILLLDYHNLILPVIFLSSLNFSKWYCCSIFFSMLRECWASLFECVHWMLYQINACYPHLQDSVIFLPLASILFFIIPICVLFFIPLDLVIHLFPFLIFAFSSRNIFVPFISVMVSHFHITSPLNVSTIAPGNIFLNPSFQNFPFHFFFF